MEPYFDDTDVGFLSPRQQPWSVSQFSADGRYYDFVKHPELVSISLEEFTPFKEKPAIQQFYRMVEWLNGPASLFETSDSRFKSPHENASPNISPLKLQSITELVFFFRDPLLNISPDSAARWHDLPRPYAVGEMSKYLMEAVGHCIMTNLADDPTCCTSLAFFSTAFTTAQVDLEKQLGHSIVTRTWVWGNTEDEVFENMVTAFNGLTVAFQDSSQQIRSAMQAQAHSSAAP